jgi:hypothetical protein
MDSMIETPPVKAERAWRGPLSPGSLVPGRLFVNE